MKTFNVFPVLCNDCNGHRVNRIQKLFQIRVTKRQGDGGGVQDSYCAHIWTDVGCHGIGPKLGMPPVVHPRHNMRPDKPTPRVAELQCPLVGDRHPGWLRETGVHKLTAACRHNNNGAPASGVGTLWKGHATSTRPYIISVLGKISR